MTKNHTNSTTMFNQKDFWWSFAVT